MLFQEEGAAVASVAVVDAEPLGFLVKYNADLILILGSYDSLVSSHSVRG